MLQPHDIVDVKNFIQSRQRNGKPVKEVHQDLMRYGYDTHAATGLIMLLARYIPIILPLAIAGSLAAKKPVPETAGTLRTDTLLFGMVILGSVIFIGALLFLPVAVLGPIAEHLAVKP